MVDDIANLRNQVKSDCLVFTTMDHVDEAGFTLA
jgi:hypothetical protein